MSERPFNVGLVGGGGDAFIVHPHSHAIFADGTRRVVAAALSSNPEKALREAANWKHPIRGFASYQEMIAANKDAAVQDKLDYILIVTPNFVHFEPAMLAMDAGIPVFCEKPLCVSLEEADLLLEKSRQTGVPFAVAHTYLGHWSSRLAQEIVRSGLLGEIRWVDSSYIQGWLASKLEDSGQVQASWRVDPSRAGGSGCGGDIGTHALMQLRYVTGLEVEKVSAQLEIFVEGRPIDDHFTAYLQLENGARGLVRASQICHGFKNDLSITVTGTKGTLRWSQENSEKLEILLPGQPDRTYWRGQVAAGDGFLPEDFSPEILAQPTLPSGHNEGLHDALARLHREFEQDVRTWQSQGKVTCNKQYAGIEDGWLGMAFLDAALQSSQQEGAFVAMKELP